MWLPRISCIILCDLARHAHSSTVCTTAITTSPGDCRGSVSSPGDLRVSLRTRLLRETDPAPAVSTCAERHCGQLTFLSGAAPRTQKWVPGWWGGGGGGGGFWRRWRFCSCSSSTRSSSLSWRTCRSPWSWWCSNRRCSAVAVLRQGRRGAEADPWMWWFRRP